MKTSDLYPRYIQKRLQESLADTPVVLIHGPRQCGKTTLAQQTGDASGYVYLCFDDEVLRAAAETDPVGFIADLPERVILDEVQHVPGLFSAIKSSVDRNRKSGRFILTGSANVLLVPHLADSLAGRMEILRLHPLAQAELCGAMPSFLNRLFEGDFRTSVQERLGRSLMEKVVAGGYPAALARTSNARRAAWYNGYLETIIQRDVQDLARISALDALPRLLTLAAGQTARLINVADLASPFQLSRPTIRDYLTLLRNVFLLDELPPWHTNQLSRLIKTSKLHIGDTGLACALLGLTADSLASNRSLFGYLLETFVYQEIHRQASWMEEKISLFHFRDKDGAEVDIVLEAGHRKIAGIEVKASATVTSGDFRGIRKLQQVTGNQFACGVVLYDGEATVPFGDRLYAVPVRCLWE